MKTKNNDNEVVTRGILRETLSEAFNEFGERFAASFGAELLSKIGIMIDAKVDKSIGDLAIQIQEGFMSVTEDIHGLTDRVTGVEGRLDAHDKEFKKINDKLDATLSEVKQVRI